MSSSSHPPGSSIAFGSDPDVSAHPPLRGARVSLTPITPNNFESLYRLELSSELGARWRFQGSTPSFEQFVQSLWAGVLAQFLVSDNDTGEAVGLVSCYNANFRNQWAYIAVAKFSEKDTSTRILLGAGLFLNYIFETWSFRKVYAETAEYSYEGFRSGAGDIFEEEGRLRNHEFYRGRYWDQIVLALHRETWVRWRPIVMPLVLKEARFQQPKGEFVPTSQWADVTNPRFAEPPGDSEQ